MAGRSAKEVYEDYVGRRKAIVRALTQDADKFWAACDPQKENLCLYGYPDGLWAVDLPAEEVPPEAPEPALGINFARDGMTRKDWLGLVAVHSDSWLLALAFYKGARLDKEGRDELFSLINKLPTCYEVVSGRVRNPASTSGGNPAPKRPPPQGVAKPPAAKSTRTAQSEEPDEADDVDYKNQGDGGTGWRDGEGDPCPLCGKSYRTDEFWIACDFCDTWFCGRCVKMTQAKSEKLKQWKCGRCGGNAQG